MDALIDRQLPFLEILAHGFIRLHQRQRKRQGVVLHRAHQILPLRIAKHQDQNAVQPFGVVLCHQCLDRLPVSGNAGKGELRRAGKGIQHLLRIAALAFHNAWENRLIILQHQREDAEARLAVCFH